VALQSRRNVGGRHVPVENFRLAGGALEGDGPAHRGGVTPGREGATIVSSGGLHKFVCVVYGSSRVNGHLRAFPKIAGDSMRHVCDVDSPILSRVRSGFQQCGNAGGRPIAIMADVHYMREATMRLVVCVTMCSMPILANAAQIDAQAPSDPQAYCVNRSADFYPYRGEPCKSGYQLGSGNCRKTDGRMVAVPKEQCAAMAGTVELPFEGGRRPQVPKP
jgi:hypothetical protein